MGGLVVFSGWSEVGYGYLVIIENNGWRTYFAHNSENLVSPGDIVAAGDVIALTGSTGNSSGPHVHFEVRHYVEAANAWIPVDPRFALVAGQEELCDWHAVTWYDENSCP